MRVCSERRSARSNSRKLHQTFNAKMKFATVFLRYKCTGFTLEIVEDFVDIGFCVCGDDKPSHN